ncbi:STT3 domain-containing protein [Desulfovibrio sp. JC010]|uniref:STT3 domain-containing protein n=1 Tax=Desulfovibrio sp. JC010 TaxID=2593641 RepID=UPI0013D7D4AE|nr:STT3 domain-containing protein [Desulfovibrio sp. JC010]NDV27188.1 hypothetical protein [Desulfovibrio sp. JC010]
MGTHDAYFWLAGAKGVGSAVDNPMAGLLRVLGSITGAPYGNIAFWLPAVFCGFTAVAAFAWGMLLGGPWTGIVASVFATSVPHFYFRTRLSYYDTDLISLLFPLLITVLMARWLVMTTKSSWFKKEESDDYQPVLTDYLLPFFAGILTCYGDSWHGVVQVFGFGTFLIGLFLALFCSKSNQRLIAMRGLLVFAASGMFGFAGVVVALALICFYLSPQFEKISNYENLYVYLVLFIALSLFSGLGTKLFFVVLNRITSYTKPTADAVKAAGPVYPGIAQSIIEAQNVKWADFFSTSGGNVYVGAAAFVCFAACIYYSPLSILLLPFAAAAMVSPFMGGRFAMFAGIPVGIGLGYWAIFLVNRFFKDKKETLVAGLTSCCLVVYLVGANFDFYTKTPVTPIISKEHAVGLIESADSMSASSTVWTWWDWGYATMYYTGQNSFANGGNHAGPVLYPLALAMSTPSLLQSSQLIKYSATQGNNPASTWSKMPVGEVQSIIGALGANDYLFKGDEDQYLVVTWKDIALSRWILYYGMWNISTGSSQHPFVGTVRNQFQVDFNSGNLFEGNNKPLPLSSYNILNSSGNKSGTFKNHSGLHLIFNDQNSQAYLIDDAVHDSTMARLLWGAADSPELKGRFELIYEGCPSVRIYKVLNQNPEK